WNQKQSRDETRLQRLVIDTAITPGAAAPGSNMKRRLWRYARTCPRFERGRHVAALQRFRFDAAPRTAQVASFNFRAIFEGAHSHDYLRRRSFQNGVRPIPGHRRLLEYRPERSRVGDVSQARRGGDPAGAHG